MRSQSGGTGIKLVDQVPDFIKKATGVGQTAENEAPAEPTRTEAQAATSTNEPAAPSPATPPSATTSAETPPACRACARYGHSRSADSAPTGGRGDPGPQQRARRRGPGQGQPEPAPAPAAPATSEPASSQSTGATGDAAVTPSPTATEQASTTPEPAPVPPAAKVVIRANRDSWIEIRDKDDAVVLQRVLRQGETFNVPDQKGLVMTTGNAGGIVIELEAGRCKPSVRLES
jgi:cytoskeleton protein RodZ